MRILSLLMLKRKVNLHWMIRIIKSRRVFKNQKMFRKIILSTKTNLKLSQPVKSNRYNQNSRKLNQSLKKETKDYDKNYLIIIFFELLFT